MFIPTQDISIFPFQPQDQADVKKLILAGMAEHWGVLDPDKNPDLNDIRTTYANATFLVAWQAGKIVGTGALVPRPDDLTGEIVRMSVAAFMRRRGIGAKILAALCEQAKSAGYRHVMLETTETWDEVIAFYKQLGFRVTHRADGDIYFILDLPGS